MIDKEAQEIDALLSDNEEMKEKTSSTKLEEEKIM
jgi:hypothetical protein